MSHHYELIIFTAAVKEYADWILEKIDPLELIKTKYYREHATALENSISKNLEITQKNLKKVIMIDNNARNFKFQPENGILIKSWFEDPNDQALFQLKALLIELVKAKPEDVRSYLKELNKRISPK